jgi:hypothetical protein
VSNISRNLAVDVHCERCGDFTVGADVIAESQRLLAAGCPGSAHECPPTLFATLLDPAALESLERAWRALEDAAGSPVRHISIDDPLRVAVQLGEPLDPRSIRRWEDDGGYIASAPSRSEPRSPAEEASASATTSGAAVEITRQEETA